MLPPHFVFAECNKLLVCVKRSCLLAVHIVTSSASDREVYSEHVTVMKALVGCRDIVVAAHESPVLRDNCVSEAVGPSGCVHVVAKVPSLASDVKRVGFVISSCDYIHVSSTSRQVDLMDFFLEN
jgi:hypothetical protein